MNQEHTSSKQAAALVTVLVGLVFPLIAAAQAVKPVPQLDANRFTGVWFEIAHLPIKQEKLCVRDAMILYSLEYKQGRLQSVQTCRRADGSTDVHNNDLKYADKSGDGRLKVASFLPRFLLAKKETVFAVATGYEWMMIGTPNHKSLWILARDATLPDATLASLKTQASASGYKTGKLIQLPHTP